MAQLYATYNVCQGKFFGDIEFAPRRLTFPNGAFYYTYFVIISSLSHGFHAKTNNAGYNSGAYISALGGFPSIGAYEIIFNEYGFANELLNQWYVVINIVDCNVVPGLFENCCTPTGILNGQDQRTFNIMWLNEYGGKQNYIFHGVRTDDIVVGKSSTYKTSNLAKLNWKIDGIYRHYQCTTGPGPVPREHVDIIASLRYSIRQWLYNEDGSTTEILVDVGSIPKGKNNQFMFEVIVNFIIAEGILIQTA